MKRRTFLTAATATLGIGTTAGCLAGGDGSGSNNGETGTDEETETPTDSTETGEPTGTETDEPAETSTSTPQSASLSSNLEATGDCSSPNSASVAFESSSVVVTGCIQGPNGCHQPVLSAAAMEGDALIVTVTTEQEGSGACTQALVQRGYEATMEFDGGLPATVEVVHDSMDEQTTVTTADR